MPELPEVETYLRELGPELVGHRVECAQIFWPRTIAAPDTQAFSDQITSLYFTGYGRRGKYMLFTLAPEAARDHPPNHRQPLDDGQDMASNDITSGEAGPLTLIVHLRMTGILKLVPVDYPHDKHTHVVLDLQDPTGSPLEGPVRKRLIFIDTRKFGRIWLTREPARVLAKLGPEPLSPAFTPAALGQKLAGRRASIKALLLEQSIVAGVGNIYADEALFHAGIHPARPGASLHAPELEKLHAAICHVLKAGILGRGSSLGGSALQNYIPPSGEPGGFQTEHRVFRRTGESCFLCQTPIERMIIAQRSTHYCPICQPRQQ